MSSPPAPATTRRASRWPRAARHRPTVHARGRAVPKVEATRATARRCARRPLGGRGAGRRARAPKTGAVLITRSTTRTSSPARARSGWRSSSRCPTCAPSWSAPEGAGCSPASPSPSSPAARRPRRGRAGRRQPLPIPRPSRPATRSAGPRCPRWPDGIAGRPRPGAVRPGQATRRRGLTVSEESISGAAAHAERAKLVVEPAGAAGVAAVLDDRRGVRAPGGRGPLRRQHRPAAAAARRAARPVLAGRYLSFRARIRGQPGARGCWRRWPPPTRRWSRSSTCAPTRGCGSTRSRCGCA